MTQDNLREQKGALRKTIGETLKEVAKDELLRQSAMVSLRLCRLPEFQNAKLILAYMAMNNECDPAIAVEEAIRQGKKVAFTLCGPERSLRLLVPQEEDAFVKGSYGIWAPLPEKCEEVEPEELDFIILPGVAFDKACNRLGRGAGYYDRLLPKTKAYLAGICLDIQLVEKLPTCHWDVPLNAIITPSAIWHNKAYL